jgi:hypothetical protein
MGRRLLGNARLLGMFGLGCLALGLAVYPSQASPGWFHWGNHGCAPSCQGPCPGVDDFGTWYWLRSPEEERRIISGYFNRYCIRCHGVDGRGVWDIPGVPDFTNPVWQNSRSDAQIARIILEGRGAVMPPFRGALSLEEAWAMARYLRTFVPGTETPKPDFGKQSDGAGGRGAAQLPPSDRQPAPAGATPGK